MADSGTGALIDPWAEAAPEVSASWDAPEPAELVEPWAADEMTQIADATELVDPWLDSPARTPSRAFPPVGVVEPW
jgi:hypothetical protein